MFVLTLHNNVSRLEYRVWRMDGVSSTLLVRGGIEGLGNEIGEHVYSYRFGSGKGKTRTGGFDEALGKIEDVIRIASRGLERVEGFVINVEAVGYLMRKRPSGVTANVLIDRSFVDALEEMCMDEPGDADLASDVMLMRSSMARFHAARHAAIFDELMFRSIRPEVRLYPVPTSLSMHGKINRFTHGALRLSSILENARRVLHAMPRRIVVCDLDETIQITAIKGGEIFASTHEYGGTSRIFSATSCGALNPLAVKAASEGTGMSCEEVIEQMAFHSGVRNMEGEFGSMRSLAEIIRAQSTGTLVEMLVDSVIFTVSGMVGLLGGIELLVISGEVGAEFPALRSLVVGRLHILRLSIDENQNESKVEEAAEITGKDCKVRIVVARSDMDRQVAMETLNALGTVAQ